MTDTQKQLLMGALKSAVSSAAGLIIALPVADSTTFSLATLGGWKHIGLVIGFTVLVAEARFWKQWADSNEPLQSKLESKLAQAQEATQEAVSASKVAASAVNEAKSVAPPKE